MQLVFHLLSSVMWHGSYCVMTDSGGAKEPLQPGLLVAEPFSWKTLVTPDPLLRIRTTGTRSSVLCLPEGYTLLQTTFITYDYWYWLLSYNHMYNYQPWHVACGGLMQRSRGIYCGNSLGWYQCGWNFRMLSILTAGVMPLPDNVTHYARNKMMFWQ